MKGNSPFCFGVPMSLANERLEDIEDDYLFRDQNAYDWEIPQSLFEDSGIFAKEQNQDCPLFYFGNQYPQFNASRYEGENCQNWKGADFQPEQNEDEGHAIKLAQEAETPENPIHDVSNSKLYNSTEKSDDFSCRRESTENCDSLSDSKMKEVSVGNEVEKVEKSEKKAPSPTPDIVKPTQGEKLSKNLSSKKEEEDEDLKPEDDPDFCYKAPRKQKFEYNKRKDVILKTILRRCRRVLQDDFNDLTGYFPNRKMQGHQFLKDCVMKFYEAIPNKPSQLDLSFYLGAMLYPQEMSRGVDCFFDCDKKERVKQRKFYRAKIQKVHDVLYRYSHEKMDYFVNVPELSYLYVLFYQKETKQEVDDQYYLNGATEIYERCKETLLAAGVSI